MRKIVVIIVVLFFLSYLYKKIKPKIKGKIGENKVKFFLRKQKGILFNDICFKTKNGNSCQIDHVLFTTKGIFVIETKNFKGSINASENLPQWTHFIGTKKFIIYSPFEQNRSHIKHLKDILGEQKYENFVVFTNSFFRVNSISDKILKLKKFKKMFKSFNKKTDVYSQNDIKLLSKKLKDYLKENAVSNKEHVSYVKKRYQKKAFY